MSVVTCMYVDDKYMLMATLQLDASSRLAKGHQWHTYPAAVCRLEHQNGRE